ncbi:hypothetical protein L1887_47986 [Cichorium endivia]|nr:hypothetical protein L1887_47986 [Cichorium endivia]
MAQQSQLSVPSALAEEMSWLSPRLLARRSTTHRQAGCPPHFPMTQPGSLETIVGAKRSQGPLKTSARPVEAPAFSKSHAPLPTYVGAFSDAGNPAPSQRIEDEPTGVALSISELGHAPPSHAHARALMSECLRCADKEPLAPDARHAPCFVAPGPPLGLSANLVAAFLHLDTEQTYKLRRKNQWALMTGGGGRGDTAQNVGRLRLATRLLYNSLSILNATPLFSILKSSPVMATCARLRCGLIVAARTPASF